MNEKKHGDSNERRTFFPEAQEWAKQNSKVAARGLDENVPLVLFSHVKQLKFLNPLHARDPFLWYNPCLSNFHDSIVRLGLQMKRFRCDGANSRACAFLVASCLAEQNYSSYRYSQWTNSRHVKHIFDRTIAYLKCCRGHDIATGNVIRWMKESVLKFYNEDTYLEQCRSGMYLEALWYLMNALLNATYRISKIVYKILPRTHNVTIITYGNSTTVQMSVLYIWEQMKKAGWGEGLRVVIIDDDPIRGSRKLKYILKSYGLQNVECMDIHKLSNTTFKVENAVMLLGCVTISANGSLLGRAGTYLCALGAKGRDIPVFALCQSYKFSHRCLIDSFAHNELYDSYTLECLLGDSYKPKECVPKEKIDVEVKEALGSWRDCNEKWSRLVKPQLRNSSGNDVSWKHLRSKQEFSLGYSQIRYADSNLRPRLGDPSPYIHDSNDHGPNGLWSGLMDIRDKRLFFCTLEHNVAESVNVKSLEPNFDNKEGKRRSISVTDGHSHSHYGTVISGKETRMAGLIPLYDVTPKELLDAVVCEMGPIDSEVAVVVTRRASHY